jgi:hypothetical protein
MASKCDFSQCAVFTKSVDEPKIRCRGNCMGEFHGCCVGLPRQWADVKVQTPTTKHLIQHFICMECQNQPNVIRKFDDMWTIKFDFLYTKISDIDQIMEKKMNVNEMVMNNVTHALDSLNSSNLDESFLSTVQDEKKTKTKTIATQTEDIQDDKDGEWRTMDTKLIWKSTANWKIYDDHMLKKQKEAEVKASKATSKTTNKLTKQKKTTNNVYNQRRTRKNPDENFYEVLDHYAHMEPPVYHRNSRQNQHIQHRAPKQPNNFSTNKRTSGNQHQRHNQQQMQQQRTGNDFHRNTSVNKPINHTKTGQNFYNPRQPDHSAFAQNWSTSQPQPQQLIQQLQQLLVQHQPGSPKSSFPSTSWASVVAQPPSNLIWSALPQPHNYF